MGIRDTAQKKTVTKPRFGSPEYAPKEHFASETQQNTRSTFPYKRPKGGEGTKAGFCDNNPALAGNEKFGFPIIAASDLKHEADKKDGVILLSMKNGREDVCRQLLSMGFEGERIVDKIPAGILDG